MHLREQGSDLIASEHHWQSLRLLGALYAVQPRQCAPQHVAVQKQDGVQRLVLRGSRYIALHGQVAEKRCDLIGAHFERMAFVMEQNESLDPLHICLLSTDAVVADSHQLTYLVE